MFKAYRVHYMPLGVALMLPGMNGSPDQYWDFTSNQWVGEYIEKKTISYLTRDSEDARNPDFRSQSSEFTSEIFTPGIIAKYYSVDKNSGKRLELLDILGRADLIKTAGLL